MEGRYLTEESLKQFKQHLISEEKSANTVEKYMRDVKVFAVFLNGCEVTKELSITYKQKLIEDGYAIKSINSMLASINSLFSFLGWYDCKIKAIKQQRQIFCSEDKELTKAEYVRLLNAAKQKKNDRLNLILQTICGTGIRVSELEFITVEAAKAGQASVNCKGKSRTVFIVKDLKKKLLQYAKEKRITTGMIFVTRSGKPISRTNIWREMKSLCKDANVNPNKVFPHNLRHLFARTFYGIEKDIAKLADILGHSSINTTRIYIISTGDEHRRKMENMKLVV
ncbi:MAG: tyrosine-type recombinase/integrase [Clostridia bacterium]|nr:tyrosine-type recombinase/integrase [Clostridia bacterium]